MLEVESPDGRHWQVRSYPLRSSQGELEGVAEIILEMTERKRMEKALRHQKQLLETIINGARDILAIQYPDRTIDRYNQTGYELLGLSPQEVHGRKCFELIGRDRECESCATREALRRKEPVSLEKYVPELDRHMECLSSPVPDEEGNIVRIVEHLRDISEQKRYEAELEAERDYMYQIFDSMSQYIFVVDQDYRLEFMNRPARNSLGDFTGRICYEELNKDTPCPHCPVPRILNQETVEPVGHRNEISGKILEGNVTKLVHRNNKVSVLHVLEDVTESEQMKEALLQSENYYRAIFETSGSAMFILEQDTTISHVNSNFKDISGYSREEVEWKKSWTEFVHPEDLEWMRQYHYMRRRDARAAPQNYEFRFFDKDNKLRHGYLTIDMIPQTTQSVVSLVDITDRKKAEEELLATKERFDFALQATNTGLWDWNVQTGEVVFNEQWAAMAGYSLDELRPLSIRTWMDLCHPDDLEQSNALLEEHFRDESAIYHCEARMKRKDGSWMWIQDRGKVIEWDESGAPLRMIGTHTDITERKLAEEALRRSENYYRAIFETSGSAMFIIEEDTTIYLANSNFQELSGYSRQEIEGMKSWMDFAHPDDAAWMKDYHYLRRRNRDAAPRRYEFRFITRQGDTRHLYLAVDLIPGTQQSIASGIDITEQKKMERKLKQLSLYDSLTGLYSRNFFEEEMKRLSDGRHSPAGIIVCDMDGLKSINDTLGHQSGDQILINAAKLLRENLRSSDILAKIGGDEFAVLLPQTGQEDVEQVLHRLRRAVESYNSVGPDLPLSLSMGHAVDEGPELDMQALFREADNRMYRDKLQREMSPRSAIVQALTKSMRARDFETEGHCDRLQELAASMAQALSLSQDRRNDLFLLARFHDLGKVGIPDQILFKPGKLTQEEWEQMRQHCEIGHRIASSVPDLAPIADLILKHHEWWDGGGYPLGLAGEDIPLPCRILAIADAYDAMTSERPYREPMSRDDAVAELRRCSGSQFDPELVEIFVKLV
jgi:diguanylate cyclase (GGDEF)-like protein/PAS domain S-box-containing protein